LDLLQRRSAEIGFVTSALGLVRNAGMLRAAAFVLAEHGAPASLAALAAAGEGRLDPAALARDFGDVDGLVRAVFEDYLVPRSAPLLDRLAVPGRSLEAALAGFADGGDGEGRLLAPFLQASIETRGLFGSRRLLQPVLAAIGREAGLPTADGAVPGEVEVAIALLADFALLSGPTRVFLPGEAAAAPSSEAALRLVIAGAAGALRGLRAAR
jgi:hypothetical protein